MRLAASSRSIISCEHVYVNYGSQEVLRDVCLEIPDRIFLPFVGPNGAGKTTLLRAILGLVHPSRGIIRSPFRHKPAGYVPQQKTIDPLYPVTTRQIVEMGLYPELGWWQRPQPEHRARVAAVLARLGLSVHQDKIFGELSGGMKQKAMLARVLVSRAEVLVLDELTLGLDEESEMEIVGHLRDLVRKEGKTVLMVHHDLDQAAAMASAVCVVRHGKASIVSAEEARCLLGGISSVRRRDDA